MKTHGSLPLLLAVALLFVSMPAFSDGQSNDAFNRKIIIKGDKNYPPYEFINDRGELDGYNIELTKALMEELNLEYEIELIDWGEAIGLITEKKVDMLMGASFSMERMNSYNFSSPHCYIRQSLVSRKDRRVKTLEGLINKQLIIQNNTLAYDVLKDAGIASRLVVVDDIGEGLKLLSAGRYDVALCEENVTKYYFKEFGIANLEYSIISDIKPVPYCFVVNKDELKLLEMVNDGFENLKAKGIYDDIFYKWFGPYEEKAGLSIVWKIIISLIIVLLVFAIAMVLFSRMKVRRATKRLRELNGELELALNAGKVAAWTYDVGNKTFYTLYGDTIFGMEGVTLTDLIKNFHQDDIPRFLHIIDSLTNGETDMASIRIRYANSDIAGGYSYIESEMSVMKKDDGTLDYIVGTEKDITKDFLYQKELEESKRRAELSDNLKSAFLANISHEIRTPLNSIVGFSELLVSSENKEEKDECKKIIRTNTELLLGLIQDILDLSKIESGDISVSNDPFDLVYLIYDIDVRFRYKIVSPDVKFICNNPYGNCIVNMDKEKVERVITGLVSNAAKFTFKGQIVLSYSYDGKGIKFMVEDTGIGIEEEKKNKVFERFQRFNDFASGTGLGLAISKALIEAMGGEIGFKSEFGKGSTFWFYVPCEAQITEKGDI